MFRFVHKVIGSTTPTVSLFHNTNSKLSHHLLERLATHDLRYLLDIRTNRLPLYDTYLFIHEECVNVHPQNSRAYEAVFPTLLQLTLFCPQAVKDSAKLRQYVPDLELVSKQTYTDLCAQHRPAELRPFVVDWANKLVAVDDKGLDTIMQNYYSCGIQNSTRQHLADGSDSITPAGSGKAPGSGTGASSSHSLRFMVHPHVAEFADLY